MSSTSKVIALLALAAAVPATAETFGFSIHSTAQQMCVAIGSETYRISDMAAKADYHVRIADDAAVPDVRIQLVAIADAADFVFVDDPDAPARCPSGARGVKTVAIGTDAPSGSTVVAVSEDAPNADYRVFVRSQRLSAEMIAALFAISRKGHTLAAR